MELSAYIPAGSDPNDLSELCIHAGVTNKALIQVGGKPIIHYVLQALEESTIVKDILIVGLKEEELENFTFSKPVMYIGSKGTNFDTAMAAVHYYNNLPEVPNYILSVSSDIPFITGEIIDRNIEKAFSMLDERKDIQKPSIELFYPITPKQTMLQQFPQANKRFRKFKEGTFATGDFFIYSPAAALKEEAQQVTKAILKNRKNMIKILGGFSVVAIVKYLMGKLSVYNDIIPALRRIMKLEVDILISDDAEICMDLDYPEDIQVFDQLIREKLHHDEVVY